MAISEEVGVLIRTIRGSMGEAAGEFRRAADSSSSMTKIVRDIANIFNAQRRDLAELQNTLSESTFEAEQSSSKLDILSSLFREMISLQSSTLSEMRDVDRGIRELDKSIFSLSNQFGGGLSGLTTTVASAGKDILEKLGAFALGGAAGAVAGAGAASMMGGGGGEGGGGDASSVAQSSGAGGKINASQAASLIRKVGGTEEEATVLGAISQPESAGNPKAHNPNRNTGDNSYGLWQVNMIDKLGPERRAKFGLKSNDELFNPETNARVALQILREANGVPRDWTTWKSGKHLKFMEAAHAGATGKATTENKKPEATTQNSASAITPKGDQTQAATTPQTSTTQQPQKSAQEGDTSPSLKPEEMAGHGHGPISGPLSEKHGEKTQGSSAIPSGDIVALGKYLQGQGLRISEHPAFGGVSPVHKGKAHYEGRAIDINVGKGATEANDPVLGAKFDQLAAQLTKAGYKVYWRESGQYGASGHNDHLHAEISGGEKSTPDTYQAGAKTPEQQTAQGATPVSAPSVTTGMAMSPVSAPSATGMDEMSPTASASEGLSQLAPSMNQQAMPLMMAGMSGIGGLSSMIFPAIQSLLGQTGGLNTPMNQQAMPLMMAGMSGIGGLASMLSPAIDSLFNQNAQLQEQPSNAEITQQLSQSATNSQIVAQAAVQQQAQQEMAQESVSRPETPSQPVSAPAPSVASSGNDAGYAYNYPSDTSWPDWAAMLGGWHYKEPQNIKKNMWS